MNRKLRDRHQQGREGQGGPQGGAVLLLGCSSTKRYSRHPLPAIQLYDGVNFRVLRSFLNRYGWPPGLQIKILSAKHGLIDGTSLINEYDQGMTREQAEFLRPRVISSLRRISSPKELFVNLGRDYQYAIPSISDLWPTTRVKFAGGGIGSKMKAMKHWLLRLPRGTVQLAGRSNSRRSYMYFFPDWDDYVLEPFVGEHSINLIGNNLSQVRRYAHEIYGDETPYDGVLISLAQLYSGKGILSRTSKGPVNIRSTLRLPDSLPLFGDCGAFSYVANPGPPFSPAEAAAHYDRLGFDVGASVDHVPIERITYIDSKGRRIRRDYSESTRRRRAKLTRDNADDFLHICRKNRYTFVPMGVIQGLGVASYVRAVHQYIEMGYKHIALGGLVPRSDSEVLEILVGARQAIQDRTRGMSSNVWLHIFGLLRPKLQASFRDLGVSSFDSASYFRKAWLRSDQNYLAPNGKRWYGSIRVPLSKSGSMQAAARQLSITSEELAKREILCLKALQDFDGSSTSRGELLERIDDYGPLLQRKGEENHFSEKHQELLDDRPWERCPCPVCQEAGINVVVFRGTSRNKRRGFHNTWAFFREVRRWRSHHVDDSPRH